MDSLLQGIPAGHQRGWTVEINGRPCKGVQHLKIHSKYGQVEYGWVSEGDGYDGLTIHEPGGGGSVIIPFAVVGAELFVGVLVQERFRQAALGRNVMNVPRGFLGPGENHFETAVREAAEETGIRNINNRIFELVGDTGNPNSAWFDTSKEGEGVRMFAIRLHHNELEESPPGYRLSNDIKPLSKGAEKISACLFIRWQSAASLGDLFTLAAGFRLMACLEVVG